MKKKSSKKSWKNIFSSKTKNSVLRLKHIQRTTSNFISKCSHVSISHIFTKISDPMAPPGDMLYSSIIFQNVVFIFNWKWRQIFFARARKTALTFLKNKIFTSGQKHRERIGTAVPKHRKTSKTDQNSKSYPKKTEGWALNSGTQFNLVRNEFELELQK